MSAATDPVEAFVAAVHNDDTTLVRSLLQNRDVAAKINDPIASFDSPVILRARSRAMLDALLDAGADLNARSRWWAGGFGFLDHASPDLSHYAIQRGAVVDVHAAARLGLIDKLREFVARDPALVHAPGGDGQTPLHFAGSIEAAQFLLEHGANIDARDVDHESTPAQYMLGDRSSVAAFLVSRGCKTDLLMAAALGDESLARRHLDVDPECIRLRVSREFFPMINRRAGGTIYQWTLGWYVSAHDVAKKFGHQKLYDFLVSRSPADLRLIVAATAGDEVSVNHILAQNPGLIGRLRSEDHRHLPYAAQNNNLPGVRLMLAAGWPVDAVGQHGATALHWAAFHGNAPMVREILRYNPPLHQLDTEYHGPPLGWAFHGSKPAFGRNPGDYTETFALLKNAGAQPLE